MNTHDLTHIQTGFHNEALGSQAVFRTALNALSHPGRVWELPVESGLPKQGHPAAALLMLSLLDADCTLWLSETLAKSDVAPWLRFHTGCEMVQDPALAHFLWVGCADEMPRLESLSLGSDAYPDRSATCVMEVSDLTENSGSWILKGPGIEDQCQLGVNTLPPDFLSQWTQNHACFPRGVDIFLVAPHHVTGLPRTTRILDVQEA